MQDSLGFLLNHAALKIKAELSRQIKNKGYNLSTAQWAILSIIVDNEGISQTNLASKTFKDKASLTRILDILEKDHLIVRERSTKDRREQNIYMTDNGKEILNVTVDAAYEANKVATAGINESKILELKEILKRVCDNL